MNATAKYFSRLWICGATSLALFAACACNSGTSLKKMEQRAAQEKAASATQNAAQSTASAAQNSPNPGIDLNCVFDRIQNPTEAFHYSYKKDGSSLVDEEADVTPQTIDGSFKNSSISRSFHGVRSDKDNWQTAWTSLMGISGMSSTVALVNHSDAMVREGAEKMNGYDAIRYSIDTGRASGAENMLYRSTLGTGGFEKGTVWVTSQGCPVKLSLDTEIHLNNGSVDKTHYEEAMVKK